ncbi:MAG: SRPBCC family protein [Myxococcales bacterium]|nr:SRPBCC family protein [Myxococcales bacterium]
MSLPIPTPLAVGGALLAAVGLSAAALPTELDVQRTRVVQASPEEITHHLAHYPDRRKWVIWTELDPAADYQFSGTPGEVGATMAWQGDEIGSATLTLEEVIPGERVISTLDYTAPFALTSRDIFELEDLGDGSTQLTWRAAAPLAFGPQRIFGLFADGMLGDEYDRSLDNLAAALETSR